MRSDYVYHRSYRGPVKAVIFDWAGTVVDYGCCAPVFAFVEAFRQKGISLNPSTVREPMGLEKKRHIQELFEKGVYGAKWNSSDVEEVYRLFLSIQVQCFRDFKEFSKLIPGTLETTQYLKKRGIRIGSTTGYNSDIITIVAAEAKKQGFEPDAVVCASDVAVARPSPWMALEAIRRMQIFPTEACIKVGDTLTDIEEGLNAGMWTIAVLKTGNELGLNETEIEKLKLPDLAQRMERARQRFLQAGVHYAAQSVADIPIVLEAIEYRIAQGEKP